MCELLLAHVTVSLLLSKQRKIKAKQNESKANQSIAKSKQGNMNAKHIQSKSWDMLRFCCCYESKMKA